MPTRELQAQLAPEGVLRLLEEGNRRFVAGNLTSRDHSQERREAVEGQYPLAIILSCVDSRVPVEDVFDLGIGDVFVARVAGNFVNADILGSMEFACKVSGSKLIVVMGHQNCGAIQSAIDGVELGNITGMLRNIAPALEACSDYRGERTKENPEYVDLVTRHNVRQAILKVRDQSPVLREMETSGELLLAGAVYDMESGRVEFIPED